MHLSKHPGTPKVEEQASGKAKVYESQYPGTPKVEEQASGKAKVYESQNFSMADMGESSTPQLIASKLQAIQIEPELPTMHMENHNHNRPCISRSTMLLTAAYMEGINIHPVQSAERPGGEYQGWVNMDVPGKQNQHPSRYTIYGEFQDDQIKAEENACAMTIEYLPLLGLRISDYNYKQTEDMRARLAQKRLQKQKIQQATAIQESKNLHKHSF